MTASGFKTNKAKPEYWETFTEEKCKLTLDYLEKNEKFQELNSLGKFSMAYELYSDCAPFNLLRGKDMNLRCWVLRYSGTMTIVKEEKERSRNAREAFNAVFPLGSYRTNAHELLIRLRPSLALELYKDANSVQKIHDPIAIKDTTSTVSSTQAADSKRELSEVAGGALSVKNSDDKASEIESSAIPSVSIATVIKDKSCSPPFFSSTAFSSTALSLDGPTVQELPKVNKMGSSQ